jgi:hypothetical protein
MRVSSFGKRIDGPYGRRGSVRRPVAVPGSIATIDGSKAVLVQDLSPGGAKLIGRHLPAPGEEVLLRTSELAVLGRVTWAVEDRRGLVFEDGERPSAGFCLGLQMRANR